MKQQESVDALSEVLKAIEGELTDATLRSVMSRLLLSTEANSSFWRFPLLMRLEPRTPGKEMNYLSRPKHGDAGGLSSLIRLEPWRLHISTTY